MAKRVRVRRERPSVLSWAFALAVTMLAVWLLTLSAPEAEPQASQATAAERVTAEIVFAGVTAHFVDMGCHADGMEARTAAAVYAARGAAGRVYEDAQGFHVLGAGYESPGDAQRIADRLAQGDAPEAAVLTLSAPEVVMRVTAPEPVCEAIVSGDRTLRQQLARAASMALQADRGELGQSSAKLLAAASASELRAAAKALESAAENPVCAGLIGLLERAANAFDAVEGAASPAALSGLLRCCHVDGTAALIAYLGGLCG